MNYQTIANYGRPTPIRRSPLVLPSCGSCPNPTSYDKDLSAIWPGGTPPAVRDYLRANCWGIPVYVNGVPLPFVEGGSSEHPERFLSYFFNRYPKAYQEQWFVENQLRGYTHGLLSLPDALASGQSMEDFKADCRRLLAAGLFVHVKIWSKVYSPLDMDLAAWTAYADPIFDALAGLVDEYSPWEYDLGNLDGQTAIDVTNYLADRAHAQGASFWCHFSPEKPFWDSRGNMFWWQNVRADGLDYQFEPEWDIGEGQARSVDVLRVMAATGKKMRAFEPGTPSLMFSGDHPDENEGDAFGLLTLCVRAAAPVWGGGAGTRQLDGWPV